ncbi:MAG: hypothetical protein RLZZ58_1657 [Pseudomonadota bacterium]
MTISPTFFADMVRENSMSSGTGNMNLIGAPPGYRAFSGVVPANTPFHYCIAGVTQSAEWESGVGSVNSSGQLERTSVSASSANGAKVDFSNGTKTVSLTVAAAWFDAVQSGGGAADMPPLDGDGASNLTALEIVAPTGMTNSAGGDDAVNTLFQSIISKFNNGPTGHVNYYDLVGGWGLNCAPNWTADNIALPAISDRIESKYSIGGASGFFAFERHMSMYATPAQGQTEYRYFTAAIPHDKTKWETHSDIGLRSSLFYFSSVKADGAGAQRIVFNFRGGAATINLLPDGASGAPQFVVEQNNRPVILQLNTASALLPLPYLNNRDETAISSAVYLSSGAVTNLFGLRSSFTHLHGAPAANDVVRYATANGAVTGSITGERFDMTATGDCLMDYRNLGAGKMAVDLVAATGGGEYRVNGQKVVGARGAALPANATDLATALTLINAMKARMVAHGLVA